MQRLYGRTVLVGDQQRASSETRSSTINAEVVVQRLHASHTPSACTQPLHPTFTPKSHPAPTPKSHTQCYTAVTYPTPTIKSHTQCTQVTNSMHLSLSPRHLHPSHTPTASHTHWPMPNTQVTHPKPAPKSHTQRLHPSPRDRSRS